MPNRWLAVAICGFWSTMMVLLARRDILPQFQLGNRPDFASLARAEETSAPVRWAVLLGAERLGTAETAWRKSPDGWIEFRSEVELRRLPSTVLLAVGGNGNLRWTSAFFINPPGNLDHFEILLFLGESKPTMTVQGKLQDSIMKMTFHSAAFTHEEQFYYEPRSVLLSSLTPIDKLPNVRLGMSWQHRVMNPITKSTELVRCEVKREQVISWRGDPVPAYVVEQSYGQMKAQCWVAHDGTVLRQEVPLGWSSLVLEHE